MQSYTYCGAQRHNDASEEENDSPLGSIGSNQLQEKPTQFGTRD